MVLDVGRHQLISHANLVLPTKGLRKVRRGLLGAKVHEMHEAMKCPIHLITAVSTITKTAAMITQKSAMFVLYNLRFIQGVRQVRVIIGEIGHMNVKGIIEADARRWLVNFQNTRSLFARATFANLHLRVFPELELPRPVCARKRGRPEFVHFCLGS